MAPETRNAPATSELQRTASTAELTAATLALARPCQLLGTGLLFLALSAALLSPADPTFLACCALAVVAGLVEFHFALRSALDAQLFAGWARLWATDSTAPDDTLRAFDASLTQLHGLARPYRSVDERAAGALRLFRHQLLALAVELAAMLAAVAWRVIQAGMN